MIILKKILKKNNDKKLYDFNSKKGKKSVMILLID